MDLNPTPPEILAVPPSETPEEHLARHPLTRELKRRGASDDHLSGMRFRVNNGGWPFDLWSFTWPDGTPKAAIPLVKAYCALKWLILENPSASRHKNDAWQYVAETLAAPIYAIGLKTKWIQSERAKKPRGRISGTEMTVAQIIRELAVRPEYMDEGTKALWPRFFAKLEECEVNPIEVENPSGSGKFAYEYDNQNRTRRITYGHFANLIAKCRREKKSA